MKKLLLTIAVIMSYNTTVVPSEIIIQNLKLAAKSATPTLELGLLGSAGILGNAWRNGESIDRESIASLAKIVALSTIVSACAGILSQNIGKMLWLWNHSECQSLKCTGKFHDSTSSTVGFFAMTYPQVLATIFGLATAAGYKYYA